MLNDESVAKQQDGQHASRALHVSSRCYISGTCPLPHYYPSTTPVAEDGECADAVIIMVSTVSPLSSPERVRRVGKLGSDEVRPRWRRGRTQPDDYRSMSLYSRKGLATHNAYYG